MIKSVLTVLLLAATSRADTFLLTVGAYQRGSGPSGAHTFMRMERVVPDGTSDTLCISWMPAGDKVRLLRGSEAGENWTWERTLDHAKERRCRISLWGPYPVGVELWNRACIRTHELASGRVQYQALDGQGQRPRAVNCIHAVSGITGAPLWTGFAYGEQASVLVFYHLMRVSR